jgi:hypothetical protein
VNDERYEYVTNDGRTLRGAAAYVLNHLDSAECAASENLRDVRADALFSEDEVIEECELIAHLRWLLDHSKAIEAYL